MGAQTLDFEGLDDLASRRRGEFAAAKPFPHVVIDDFLPRETAARVHDEFLATREGWDYYHHYNERKMALTHAERMRDATRELVDALQSRRFVETLERLTGIEGLVADPELHGAGLHQVLPGGYLNMHADFLAHATRRNWSRQINLLVYFNRDWSPEWKGALELWDADMAHCVQAIEPFFNRCVIFQTSETSYHGHPHRLTCPSGVARKALALYYYREEPSDVILSPTRYRPRPGDLAAKRLLMALDDFVLRGFSFLKRHLGLSDGLVSRLLKRL